MRLIDKNPRAVTLQDFCTQKVLHVHIYPHTHTHKIVSKTLWICACNVFPPPPHHHQFTTTTIISLKLNECLSLKQGSLCWSRWGSLIQFTVLFKSNTSTLDCFNYEHNYDLSHTTIPFLITWMNFLPLATYTCMEMPPKLLA